MSAITIQPLKLMVVLGSTRPNRICTRVASFVRRSLEQRGHTVQVVDPLEIELPLLQQPHFAYPKGAAPPKLEQLARDISSSEGYVVVCPEYNHSIPPAVTNTFDHFGGSLFAWKPSAIVTYSIGQFGGVRAAMALRPFLSEVGCLPVSSILAIPKAHQVFKADGTFADAASEAEWVNYATKTWAQLEWVGTAFKEHKLNVDPWTYTTPNRAMNDRLTPGA